MAPFYGWGSTASRLVPLRGGSLLFTTKFPDIPGTHFIISYSSPETMNLMLTFEGSDNFYQKQEIMCDFNNAFEYQTVEFEDLL